MQHTFSSFIYWIYWMVLFITQIQLNFILITKALFQTLKDVGFDLLFAHVPLPENRRKPMELPTEFFRR